jgi:hypothetical protein
VEKKNLANRIAAGEKTRFLRLIFWFQGFWSYSTFSTKTKPSISFILG